MTTERDCATSWPNPKTDLADLVERLNELASTAWHNGHEDDARTLYAAADHIKRLPEYRPKGTY